MDDDVFLLHLSRIYTYVLVQTDDAWNKGLRGDEPFFCYLPHIYIVVLLTWIQYSLEKYSLDVLDVAKSLNEEETYYFLILKKRYCMTL